MTRALTLTLASFLLAASATLPVLAEENSNSPPTFPNDLSAQKAISLESDSASTSASDSASNSAGASESSTDKKLIAESGDAHDKHEGKEDSKKEPAKKSKSGGGGSSTGLATRLASFTTGVVFGTPIAIVRRTGIEIVQGEHDLIGDTDSWYKKAALVFPGMISVPYGAISGGASGCLYAVKNAWSGSADEPFGKESFSLGDIGN